MLAGRQAGTCTRGENESAGRQAGRQAGTCTRWKKWICRQAGRQAGAQQQQQPSVWQQHCTGKRLATELMHCGTRSTTPLTSHTRTHTQTIHLSVCMHTRKHVPYTHTHTQHPALETMTMRCAMPQHHTATHHTHAPHARARLCAPGPWPRSCAGPCPCPPAPPCWTSSGAQSRPQSTPHAPAAPAARSTAHACVCARAHLQWGGTLASLEARWKREMLLRNCAAWRKRSPDAALHVAAWAASCTCTGLGSWGRHSLFVDLRQEDFVDLLRGGPVDQRWGGAASQPSLAGPLTKGGGARQVSQAWPASMPLRHYWLMGHWALSTATVGLMRVSHCHWWVPGRVPLPLLGVAPLPTPKKGDTPELSHLNSLLWLKKPGPASAEFSFRAHKAWARLSWILLWGSQGLGLPQLNSPLGLTKPGPVSAVFSFEAHKAWACLSSILLWGSQSLGLPQQYSPLRLTKPGPASAVFSFEAHKAWASSAAHLHLLPANPCHARLHQLSGTHRLLCLAVLREAHIKPRARHKTCGPCTQWRVGVGKCFRSTCTQWRVGVGSGMWLWAQWRVGVSPCTQWRVGVGKCLLQEHKKSIKVSSHKFNAVSMQARDRPWKHLSAWAVVCTPLRGHTHAHTRLCAPAAEAPPS